ncbi:MAG: chorismate mutase [cyanobacterium endosymbiont of Rhopalodia gibba]
MHVEGSLHKCIQLLIHFNIPKLQVQLYHSYS